MKIKTDFQQNKLKNHMNTIHPQHINRFENNNFINTNILDHIAKTKKNEEQKDFNEKRRNINYTYLIPNKIMKTLLTSMNKNNHMPLNNFNSINFIYQTYEKGIDILQHKKINRNKSSNIENCVNQRKIFTNYNPNFSIFSTIIGNGANGNEMYENFKSGNNDELMNFNESFNNKENCSNLILPNNFFKNNFSMKNIDSNHTSLINKRKYKKKFKPVNIMNTRYIVKRNNSCKIEDDRNFNKSKTNNKLLSNNNEYDTSNNFANFALLPLKNIYSKYKKIEKLSPSSNNRNIKSSMHRKTKYNNEKENPLTIKMFTEKYEKEKENFNNILFDECIELRKKKFKLESFIKRFTNKHFVEKLYKAKEYSVKKNMIK